LPPDFDLGRWLTARLTLTPMAEPVRVMLRLLALLAS
jgi:hypothetical protein